MKVTVWVLSTCLPDEGLPQVVGVYGSEPEARAAFDETMRSEWESNGPYGEETGEELPYPGDPQEAHDLIDESRSRTEESDGLSEVWGRYELSSHKVECAAPSIGAEVYSITRNESDGPSLFISVYTAEKAAEDAIKEDLAELSTDVRNWTLFDIENWTPGVSVLSPQARCRGGLSR